MPIIKKPDYTIFASEAKNGELSAFPNLLRGWGVTIDQTAGKPPMEWFNTLQKRTDEWLTYLSQRGISEWDNTLDYPKNSVVQSGGNFYVSITENKSKSPDKSQSDWRPMADALNIKIEDATLKSKGIVQLSNATDSASDVLAVTPKAVKAVNDSLKSLRESLGSASTGNIVTSKTDATEGRIPVVGWMGIGVNNSGSGSAVSGGIDYVSEASGIWQTTNENTTGTFPAGTSHYGVLFRMRGNKNDLAQLYFPSASVANGGSIHYRQYNATSMSWGNWVEIYRAGKIIPITDGGTGAGTVDDAMENLGLGAGSFPVGMPFFWPSAKLPNQILPEWSNQVFLKWNGATFSAAAYPKLALVIPSLMLTDARGEFPRIWDDGRGVDSGRALLSTQGDAIRNITANLAQLGGYSLFWTNNQSATGAFSVDSVDSAHANVATGTATRTRNLGFDASRVVPTDIENRPRNIAFNFLVRAK